MGFLQYSTSFADMKAIKPGLGSLQVHWQKGQKGHAGMPGLAHQESSPL